MFSHRSSSSWFFSFWILEPRLQILIQNDRLSNVDGIYSRWNFLVVVLFGRWKLLVIGCWSTSNQQLATTPNPKYQQLSTAKKYYDQKVPTTINTIYLQLVFWPPVNFRPEEKKSSKSKNLKKFSFKKIRENVMESSTIFYLDYPKI
ncbi:hypothetical protein BpHYR1_007605 [Brachionus plicatilis]|uniref:Uncharacterized protein n=1 Tax=Brachionus plicatilis TaxID=10195 RepID=A0A3M7S0X3_BRAPC|nr:hypothetical protein BpHYR1_007605 [Brachionus plicatilis]